MKLLFIVVKAIIIITPIQTFQPELCLIQNQNFNKSICKISTNQNNNHFHDLHCSCVVTMVTYLSGLSINPPPLNWQQMSKYSWSAPSNKIHKSALSQTQIFKQPSLTNHAKSFHNVTIWHGQWWSWSDQLLKHLPLKTFCITESW